MGSGRPGVEPLRGQRRDGGRRVAPPETEPALVKTGVCRIERRRTVKGRTQATVSYAVTSVAPAVGGADRLLRVLRKHWDIENRVHWVRDVTFDEDRSQVRTGNAPQSLPSATTGGDGSFSQPDQHPGALGWPHQRGRCPAPPRCPRLGSLGVSRD